MGKAWNKGHTKESHPSVLKISQTMRGKKIDNFKGWRKMMRETGHFATIVRLNRSGDLAELIGVILGDGNIYQFPRTEGLRIVSNANNPGFVARYTQILSTIFGKSPHVHRDNRANCLRITLYQRHISRRLGIPTGSRKRHHFILPGWIGRDRDYLFAFLRGLYEAEGSLSYHPATYTHKIVFSNRNPSLLRVVAQSLRKLGFHPHSDAFRVQLSRKAEVQLLADLIQFRRY